MLCEMNMADDL
jgi:hypothetical protein